MILTALISAEAAGQEVDCDRPACETRVSSSCLSRVGAGVLAAGEDCATEQAAYLACLRRVAETCGARPRSGGAAATGGCSAEDARQMFDAVSASDDPADLDAFVDACPQAPQARLARLKADRLRAEAADPRNAMPGDWRRASGDACVEVLRIKRVGDTIEQWKSSGNGDFFQYFPARKFENGAALFPFIDGTRGRIEERLRIEDGALVIEREGVGRVCRYERF